jgi:hypothetical protein
MNISSILLEVFFLPYIGHSANLICTTACFNEI